MKTTLLLLLTLTITTAFSQTTSSIGAGLTLNKIEGVDVGAGYYASLNTHGKLNDYIGFYGSFQFSNFHAKVSDTPINYYTIDPSFYLKLYPAKEAFSFLGGFDLNYIINSKVDGEKFEPGEQVSVFLSAGASYEITEKIEIIARYNHPIYSSDFNWCGQIGVSYHF